MLATLMMQTSHLAPSSGQANLVFLKYWSVMGMQMQLAVAPGTSLFSLISCDEKLFWAETSPVILKRIILKMFWLNVSLQTEIHTPSG